MIVKNFIDIKDILKQVRENKHEEFISYKLAKQSGIQLIFSTARSDISNPINKTDNSIDVDEWKPGATLIVGDLIIAGLSEAKHS